MSIKKIQWIEQWAISTKSTTFDALNQKFINDYVERFNPKHEIPIFGALFCPEIGRILSLGYKKGYFNRGRVSLPNAFIGYPKWIYVYSLKHKSNEQN